MKIVNLRGKKIGTIFLTIMMLFTVMFPSSLAFAETTDTQIGENEISNYEISSVLSEDKKTIEVSLNLEAKEGVTIDYIILPDGAQKDYVDEVNYTVDKNGYINFETYYTNSEGEKSKADIGYTIAGIEEKEETAETSTVAEEQVKTAVTSTRSTETITLDVADGRITIDEAGYRRGNANDLSTPHVPFTGSYIITGTYPFDRMSGEYGPQAVTVSGGTEADPINMTIKDLTIDGTSEVSPASNGATISIGRASPYDWSKEGHVNLTLEGENTLKGTANGAGIEVYGSKAYGTKSTLVIGGSGSLDTQGGRNGAGLGGNSQSGSKVDYKLTINSGNIIATGGETAAGIGAGRNTSGGEIIINGGNITAIGGKNGAGIGGGLQQSGSYWNNITDMSITINGGTVVASSTDLGAGIGTGRLDISATLVDREKANTTINIGGTANVTATGGRYGAGIGQGVTFFYNDVPDTISPRIVDEINISGGTIKAIGGSGGAGIGGANTASIVKNINISGGDITANGDYLSPGIGSGSSGSTFENISVSGGKIKATGGNYAAGIGTGYKGIGGKISLTGGEVFATSILFDPADAGMGPGIGSGYGASIEGIHIGSGADVTAIANTYASGIGRAYFAEGAPENVFPIVIEKGAVIKAYAMGDIYSEDTKANPDDTVIPDAPYISAIDQGCMAHADSKFEAGMLMGDFKEVPNKDGEQRVSIKDVQTGEIKEITLPKGYASFATTVSQGLHKVIMNDVTYGGDVEKRTEDNLLVKMGGDAEELYAYWMLQPKTIEWTVDFEFVSTENPEGISAPNAVTVEDEMTINAPTLTESENWTFDGWYTDQELTTKFDFTTAITDDMKLYGKWTYNEPKNPIPEEPGDGGPSETSEPKGTETGDDADVGLYMGLMLMAGAIAIVVRRRSNSHIK